jgi:hypothetical protein
MKGFDNFQNFQEQFSVSNISLSEIKNQSSYLQVPVVVNQCLSLKDCMIPIPCLIQI